MPIDIVLLSAKREFVKFMHSCNGPINGRKVQQEKWLMLLQLGPYKQKYPEFRDFGEHKGF
jgi:hypothetical protein